MRQILWSYSSVESGGKCEGSWHTDGESIRRAVSRNGNGTRENRVTVCAIYDVYCAEAPQS